MQISTQLCKQIKLSKLVWEVLQAHEPILKVGVYVPFFRVDP